MLWDDENTETVGDAGIMQDDIDALMAGESSMEQRAGGPPPPPSHEMNSGLPKHELVPSQQAKGQEGYDLNAVYDIPVQLSAVLGKASMPVNQLLKLGRGAVVELDRRVGEAIDIYVNNKLIARGEVVLVEDRLGVTMTEIIKADKV